MTYRLVALDLDGTLLDSQLQIRAETMAELSRLRARGIQAMIVTGRHHVAAYPYWKQLGLDLPAICCNGAYIYDFVNDRPLAGDPLTRDQARRLLALSRQHAVFTMVYDRDAMAYETIDGQLQRMLNWAATLPPEVRPRFEKVASFERLVDSAPIIWKFISAADDATVMRTFVDAVEQELGLCCVWSGATRLDITQRGNSKGSRLAEWIAARGIAAAEVIAFGDHQNDIEMLRMAGMGVAMGNSLPDVQACADWVTGSNDGNGIADALQRFVLTPA